MSNPNYPPDSAPMYTPLTEVGSAQEPLTSETCWSRLEKENGDMQRLEQVDPATPPYIRTSVIVTNPNYRPISASTSSPPLEVRSAQETSTSEPYWSRLEKENNDYTQRMVQVEPAASTDIGTVTNVMSNPNYSLDSAPVYSPISEAGSAQEPFTLETYDDTESATAVSTGTIIMINPTYLPESAPTSTPSSEVGSAQVPYTSETCGSRLEKKNNDYMQRMVQVEPAASTDIGTHERSNPNYPPDSAPVYSPISEVGSTQEPFMPQTFNYMGPATAVYIQTNTFTNPTHPPESSSEVGSAQELITSQTYDHGGPGMDLYISPNVMRNLTYPPESAPTSSLSSEVGSAQEPITTETYDYLGPSIAVYISTNKLSNPTYPPKSTPTFSPSSEVGSAQKPLPPETFDYIGLASAVSLGTKIIINGSYPPESAPTPSPSSEVGSAQEPTTTGTYANIGPPIAVYLSRNMLGSHTNPPESAPTSTPSLEVGSAQVPYTSVPCGSRLEKKNDDYMQRMVQVEPAASTDIGTVTNVMSNPNYPPDSAPVYSPISDVGSAQEPIKLESNAYFVRATAVFIGTCVVIHPTNPPQSAPTSSPSTEVGSAQEPSTSKTCWSRLEKENEYMQRMMEVDSVIRAAITLPIFTPDSTDVDAHAWCRMVDNCLKEQPLEGDALVLSLRKSLKGDAYMWFSQEMHFGLTWSIFKVIFLERYAAISRPNEGESLASQPNTNINKRKKLMQGNTTLKRVKEEEKCNPSEVNNNITVNMQDLCYYCYEYGHKSEKCRSQERMMSFSRVPTMPRRCLNCGNIGHITSDCMNQSQNDDMDA